MCLFGNKSPLIEEEYLDNLIASKKMMDFPTVENGARVKVRNFGVGVVKFYGRTHFATGFFVGIELDKPLGKHNGFYDGKRYFTAKEKHAIFVRKSRLLPLDANEAREHSYQLHLQN